MDSAEKILTPAPELLRACNQGDTTGQPASEALYLHSASKAAALPPIFLLLSLYSLAAARQSEKNTEEYLPSFPAAAWIEPTTSHIPPRSGTGYSLHGLQRTTINGTYFQMNLFSKSPKKSKKTPTSDEESHSPRSRSPLKKSSSSSSKSGKGKEENHRPGQGSARNSRSFPKAGPESPRHPFDLNTHPLNLPPDQIRRLSALSSMSDPDRMDIDSEGPNGAPASPSPQTNMPGSFDSPKMNGTNGSPSNEGPVPPPHKSNPTSPATVPASTPEEAEAFKTAGNKFYKAKEYKKAIEEYTKGKESRWNTKRNSS